MNQLSKLCGGFLETVHAPAKVSHFLSLCSDTYTVVFVDSRFIDFEPLDCLGVFLLNERLVFSTHVFNFITCASTKNVPCREMSTPRTCHRTFLWTPLIHVKYRRNQCRPNIIWSLVMVIILRLVRCLSEAVILFPAEKTFKLAAMHSVILTKTKRNIGPVNSNSLIHPCSMKHT